MRRQHACSRAIGPRLTSEWLRARRMCRTTITITDVFFASYRYISEGDDAGAASEDDDDEDAEEEAEVEEEEDVEAAAARKSSQVPCAVA